MQPQRETMTDSLADIIQIIHLGSKNGRLTVERGEGNKREEGFITFLNGNVIEARIGPYDGAIAFNYLNTWRTCRFAFVNDVPALPPGQGRANGTTNPLPPPNAFIYHATTPEGQNNSSYLSNGRGGSHPSFPVRLQQGEATLHHLENAQIPRLHRRLLLLVNGQRGVDELARLMGRSFDEVETLLSDLERAGLIRR